jgi:hypothetical protein
MRVVCVQCTAGGKYILQQRSSRTYLALLVFLLLRSSFVELLELAADVQLLVALFVLRGWDTHTPSQIRDTLVFEPKATYTYTTSES